MTCTCQSGHCVFHNYPAPLADQNTHDSLAEQAYLDHLWEEQESAYWAEQEMKWAESQLTEIETKISQKILDTVQDG